MQVYFNLHGLNRYERERIYLRHQYLLRSMIWIYTSWVLHWLLWWLLWYCHYYKQYSWNFCYILLYRVTFTLPTDSRFYWVPPYVCFVSCACCRPCNHKICTWNVDDAWWDSRHGIIHVISYVCTYIHIIHTAELPVWSVARQGIISFRVPGLVPGTAAVNAYAVGQGLRGSGVIAVVLVFYSCITQQ